MFIRGLFAMAISDGNLPSGKTPAEEQRSAGGVTSRKEFGLSRLVGCRYFVGVAIARGPVMSRHTAAGRGANSSQHPTEIVMFLGEPCKRFPLLSLGDARHRLIGNEPSGIQTLVMNQARFSRPTDLNSSKQRAADRSGLKTFDLPEPASRAISLRRCQSIRASVVRCFREPAPLIR